MATHSLKENLIRFLAHAGVWESKGKITDGMIWRRKDGRPYLSETVGRQLRIAESESRIAVKDDEHSVSVVYKFLPPEKRAMYIPYSARTDKTKLFHD